MKSLEMIKEALQPLQRIPGVTGCWLEVEDEDIFHIYTMTREADYDLDTRIFREYACVEARFPDMSFEFLITSRHPSVGAEIVFLPTPRTPMSAVALA